MFMPSENYILGINTWTTKSKELKFILKILPNSDMCVNQIAALNYEVFPSFYPKGFFLGPLIEKPYYKNPCG